MSLYRSYLLLAARHQPPDGGGVVGEARATPARASRLWPRILLLLLLLAVLGYIGTLLGDWMFMATIGGVR